MPEVNLYLILAAQALGLFNKLVDIARSKGATQADIDALTPDYDARIAAAEAAAQPVPTDL